VGGSHAASGGARGGRGEARGMNGDPDPFNLEGLVLPEELKGLEKRRIFGKEKRRLGHFTRFPNMWAWRLRKSRSATAWKLARFLLWEHWRRGLGEGEAFTVGRAACRAAGIAKNERGPALRELESVGLVRIKYRYGTNPEVVLLNPEPDKYEVCGGPSSPDDRTANRYPGVPQSSTLRYWFPVPRCLVSSYVMSLFF
jgi:hypothetical protein